MNPRGAPTPAGRPIARSAGDRDVSRKKAGRVVYIFRSRDRQRWEREKADTNYKDPVIRKIDWFLLLELQSIQLCCYSL